MTTDPDFAVDDTLLAFRVDDFTDGWIDAPQVMLLHGIAESAEAFNGWVPHLARHCRVIRPDLRGHGRSGPVQKGETLSVARLADDVQALANHLRLEHVHVVGAKLGAQVALELAQRRAPWMVSLTLAGVLISPADALGKWLVQWMQLVDEQGVEGWARATMPGRMGAALPAAGLAWWTEYMGRTQAETARACFRLIAASREPRALEQICCPTQVIAPVQPGQAAAFKQQPSLDEVRRWLARIPGARLVELPADSYHIAATHPDDCAALTAKFIKEHTS
ncbi:alpha/beta fold hydrolase [Bordetella sp. BOR01]|uniref:alpha/beta fold hydrolase n=1 Tax=Bordetella sp. BOR01 TaxID=2854779 RepID=UPI001C441D03|nr:alpha/beta hydrolase [Bordetella sp. BOR01]MBV7485005.1 alpha/beta hydrolase [Bordetella sp. BOR01]